MHARQLNVFRISLSIRYSHFVSAKNFKNLLSSPLSLFSFAIFFSFQVIPAEEHAAKIASARDAIGESDFFLVARTDARATSAKTGLSDSISRANLYMEVCIVSYSAFSF